ncbi:hypothetical protein SNEBB_005897 [Seison nebaliae]|nr:hypothetical protein SNEBB_005897 [Seison nebaliae]
MNCEEFIDDSIKYSTSDYVVFGRPSCPYCKKAEVLLDENKLDYRSIDLEKKTSTTEEKTKMSDAFLRRTGAKTVPRIFFNGKCIGGYTDLEKHLSSTNDKNEGKINKEKSFGLKLIDVAYNVSDGLFGRK